MISLRDIHKYYGAVHVLKGIDLDIAEGEIVAIVGKSGAGKSTLLHILGSLERPSQGKVLYDGEDISLWSEAQLAEFRNKHIGFVFQFHHLLPEFTALENVALPALIGGMPKKAAFDRAAELLRHVGLEERIQHRPAQLSGGEQQRVALVRALINDPRIVLADEPTGNLDTPTSVEIHKWIRKLRDTFFRTFVIVTHSRDLANMCDRIITIQDGKLIKEESPTPQQD